MGGWSGRVRAALLVVLLVALAAGCGGDGGGDGRPTVAVTTTVLGSLVHELVADRAEVRVILPNGVDPHEFQPSARDVEALAHADLIVANGLGLEEGLTDAIDRAREDGVPVVEATGEVPLLTTGGAEDPHVWMDPIRMRAFVRPLAARITGATGLRLDDRRRRLERRLTALDARVRRQIGRIPPGRRRLVTGHESLAYYADRYGLRVVGAVVPRLSSQAEPSAAGLAELRAAIARERVPSIFTETGFPPGVAAAIADETGARVIPVSTEALPDDESYAGFIDAATRAFVAGLAPEPAP